MGGGSTIAAAEFNDYESIGIEADPAYFDLAAKAIPRLATYVPGRNDGDNSEDDEKPNSSRKGNGASKQRSLFD